MEVHRQRCQACGSLDLRNVLVREPGEPTSVFVRCAQCGELVAHYRLRSYYHHGKDMESYLRSIEAEESESGRQHLTDYNAARERAEKGYESALKVLKDAGKEI